MKATKAHVVNLGCKVNRVESDAFEALLVDHGCTLADLADSDLVIVNTCTVTGEAEKKTRKAVRHALRQNAQATVIVTGCAAVIDADIFSAMSERVQVVSKQHMQHVLIDIIGAPVCCPSGPSASRTRVGVKVQDGCDNACTYCIVRVARGAARSKPARAVIERCEQLVNAGISEIVLTGINLGSYCDEDGATLTSLIARLLPLAERAPVRFRLSSIEPQDVDDALIELLAEAQGRLCRHVHLPLQSGSTRVLRQMARRYTATDFEALIARFRARVPSISLTTDIIAGFPGETDDDHRQTIDLAQRCGFSKMHVFPYSERAGTPAATRTDQVPHEVRAARARELRALADTMRQADLAQRAGSSELVVVEERGRGCTESYHEVALSPDEPVGAMVPYRFAIQ